MTGRDEERIDVGTPDKQSVTFGGAEESMGTIVRPTESKRDSVRRRSRIYSNTKSNRSSVASYAANTANALEHFAGKNLEEHPEYEGIGGEFADEFIEKTTDIQTFMTLVKAFVGPAHIYLAKGMADAGLWLGLASLFFCASLNAFCVMLLVQVKKKVKLNSYPDMGGSIYGPWMKVIVDACLVMSQFGLATMYYIFVAETIKDAIANIDGCAKKWVDLPLSLLIGIQVLLQMPISWVKQIRSISFFAIGADVCIFAAMVWVIGDNAVEVGKNGFPETHIANTSYPLFFGTAVLAFEGIGVMMPVHEAMANPDHFLTCVWGSIMVCCIFFSCFAVFGYGARGGTAVPTNVLLAMPQTPLSQAAKICYCIGVFLSFSLQAFPAYRIVEQAFNIKTSYSLGRNICRSVIVVILGLIAWAGADNLGNFVSLVGGLTMIPLAFVLPTLFHLRCVAETWGEKCIDTVIATFGIACMLLATGMAIAEWVKGHHDNYHTCADHNNTATDLWL